jgi:hypothetical protein
MAAAPLPEDIRQGSLEEPRRLPCLRVRYTLPPLRAEHWHVISFTALLGAEEEGFAQLYLDLCDAFVSATQWEEAP